MCVQLHSRGRRGRGLGCALRGVNMVGGGPWLTREGHPHSAGSFSEEARCWSSLIALVIGDCHSPGTGHFTAHGPQVRGQRAPRLTGRPPVGGSGARWDITACAWSWGAQTRAALLEGWPRGPAGGRRPNNMFLPDKEKGPVAVLCF